jgi:hypothetical protein
MAGAAGTLRRIPQLSAREWQELGRSALDAAGPRALLDGQSLLRWAPIVVVVAAGVVRIIDLTGSPPGFYVDEVSNALDAYAIGHTLRDQHGALLPAFFQALGDWRGGLYIYWDVPFVDIFGMTEFAVRLGSVVLGTLTVWLVYLFVGKAANRWVGLISAFLLATSPWHLMQSRVGWEIVTVPFVTALFLTLLYFGFDRPRLLPLAFLSGALGLYTYQPGRLFFPMLCLLCMAIYARELWDHRAQTAIGLGLAGVAAVPAVVAFANGTISARFSQIQTPTHGFGDWLSTMWMNYLAHFQAGFLFDTSNDWITRHYVRGFGMLYGIELPFLVLGIAAMLVRHRRADLLFLGWFLIYPIPAAIVGQPFSTRSISGVIVFQIAVAQGVLLTVAGIAWAARWLRIGRQAVIVTGAILTAIGIATAAGFMTAYIRDYPTYAAGWDGWQAGGDQIVAYFEQNRGHYDHMYMDSDFNAADEILRFYATGYPDRCAACSVVNTDDPRALHQHYNAGERELWALTPAQLQSSNLAAVPHRVVGHLTYPGGETSFLFVDTGQEVRAATAAR